MRTADLTTSCADCLEIWQNHPPPQKPQGLYRDCLTFLFNGSYPSKHTHSVTRITKIWRRHAMKTYRKLAFTPIMVFLNMTPWHFGEQFPTFCSNITFILQFLQNGAVQPAHYRALYTRRGSNIHAYQRDNFDLRWTYFAKTGPSCQKIAQITSRPT